ncbi:rhodanese-related sulfurtransferase [Pontibacter sp. G13]|uniref:oxygen-dependent tRNA uridine(34) hydroxylase TrhO n=1 Tax=Pontibacter sp. G13 TaxID=3074898 RepID=UPI00288980EC|nr:rhodanese-related sulfurtransferase [Pontibacter sp. G13]WNJ21511.1 rhodanese-related sulfurtransferase [Pontibacter sp. G13]
MALHNKVNSEELKQQMLSSEEARTTISFYCYHQFEDPQAFRNELFQKWSELGVFGRTYVAKEGINAQISVPSSNFEALRDQLYRYPFFDGMRLNVAYEDDGKSFYKLIIKVRPKILADGLDDDTFNPSECGQHLKAEEFNALMDRDDSILIDMRNHYETEVGHFKGAITPDVDTFRESLPIIEDMLKEHADKHIMMYCTGGIRCEKASAWFKHQGFEKVYQLEGGIIKYAQDAKAQGLENKFIGKNFVFDERMGERISDDVIAHCHQCGKPCDTHTNCKNVMCNLLFIQCDECAEKHAGCCSNECHEIVQLPEEEQMAMRKGKDSGVRIFSKGRFKKAPKVEESITYEEIHPES